MNFYAQFSDSLSDPLGSHCSFPFPPPRFTTALRNSRNIRSNITVEGTNLSSELIEIPKATLLLLYSFFTTRLEADKWAAVKQTERWFAIVLNRKLIKDKLSPGGTIPASRKRKTSLRWKGKGYVEFSMRFHRVRSVKRRDNRVEQTLRGGSGGGRWRSLAKKRVATRCNGTGEGIILNLSLAHSASSISWHRFSKEYSRRLLPIDISGNVPRLFAWPQPSSRYVTIPLITILSLSFSRNFR